MRFRFMALLAAIGLVVGACGGGDNSGAETTAASNDSAPTNETDNRNDQESIAGSSDPSTQADGPRSGGSGSFQVDDDTFDVVELRRCPPFDFYGEENPDDLDLVAAGDGVYLSLVISNSDGYAPGGDSLVTFNQQHHELRVNRFGDGGQEQYTSTASHDPDGNWFLNFIPGMGEMVGEDPLDGAPFTISGNTISGGLHLIQDWPEGETGEIDVTFNLEVPSSIGEC